MNSQLFMIFGVVLITVKRILDSFYSNLFYKNSKNVNVYEYKNNIKISENLSNIEFYFVWFTKLYNYELGKGVNLWQ